MELRRLGRTELRVSEVCLGTMTWGEQNSEAEAHRQLDLALDRGVTFIDTAEMYPVPPRPETQGRTEQYIGSWLKARRNRDKIVLASKVVGATRDMHHIRGGSVHLDAANIAAALDASLARLHTDHLDLYQLHWPDRRTNNFGRLGYEHDPSLDGAPLDETLTALDAAVRAGMVRAIGLSNDTPWGVHRCLVLAETRGLPRIASIQNPYNLLNRTFEVGLAEMAMREEVGLLSYSPLAGGTLTGKYLDGARPPGARMTLFNRFTRYDRPLGIRAVERYVALARQHGLDPAQMALAYIHRKPWVTSTIIGATKPEQLKADLDAFALPLPPDVTAGIDAIHAEIPNPCP